MIPRGSQGARKKRKGEAIIRGPKHNGSECLESRVKKNVGV